MKLQRCRSFWPLACAFPLLCFLVLVLASCTLTKSRNITSLPGGSALGDGDGPRAPGGLSSEEIWVIARGNEPASTKAEDAPGSGALITKLEDKQIQMPLKHTDVKAFISGHISTVEVTQEFQNPYDQKIEAIYVFPLPHNAAINEFIMMIGERRIRGIIRERKEAEQIYLEARRQGYVASLLTEERPNVFTQSVANIEPAKEIHINIKYFHTLEYADGWYQFIFPMVVGPRFNPPGTTGGTGAVAHGSSGASEQDKEIQYLRPRGRTGHDISLQVEVDAGVPIEEFECNSHEITSRSPAPEHLSVTLNPADNLPNKDFVLRYRIAGDRIKSSLLTHHDERGSFFNLILYPPRDLTMLARQPLEMVFVIDCSGSMSGRPIEQAKAAIERGLRLLQPDDSFQLISFSMTASQLGRSPLPATARNIGRALEYLRSLEGEGGTMMIEGIKAALEFPHDPHRLRFVCFLTDGYIGNETEILSELHKRLGASRIFSFGIGSAVNRYLIESLGSTGRGAVAYLGPHDDAAQIMEDFFSRISHPAMTDLQIDWGGLQVAETFPRALPDLFGGRRVIVSGRFTSTQETTLHVTGIADGQPLRLEVPAKSSDLAGNHEALPSVWARMKIADLATQASYQPDPDLTWKIKGVALDYNLMSAFTAFIAVDSTSQTEGATGTTVPVAIPVPEGVKYDTTVSEH